MLCVVDLYINYAHLVHVLSDLICKEGVIKGHDLIEASFPIRGYTNQEAAEEGPRIIEK